eukprot:126925-Rhodomonas_salina.1
MSAVMNAPVMSQCFSIILSCVAIDMSVLIAVKREVGAKVVEYSSSVCMSPRATSRAFSLAIAPLRLSKPGRQGNHTWG